MTNKEAQTIIGNLPIYGDDCYSITEYQEAKAMAIKALETLEEFERAQIIMGGRLNGRTYAYKCGLEDGKRKALDKEPCEDAISRLDLRDAISNLNYWHANQYGELRPGGAGEYATVYKANDVERMADNLPSVTPIRPKGAWVGIDEEPHETWECDHCGFVIDCSGCDDPTEYRDDAFKFCPRCGVDMRGEIVEAESEE